MNEKRKAPRVGSVNLSYICLDQEGKIVHQAMGRTLNVSEGGFLIETTSPLDVDNTLVVSIGLKDDIFEARGRVVHCRAIATGYRSGVQLIEIVGDKTLWDRFIKNSGAS